ncbi:MAG: hypothetical protein WCA79_00310 [Anaerolineales bacterium]
MIKIDSFTPANNFARTSWEFHDDQMVVKTKSLSADYRFELEYKKIKSIQSKKMSDVSWIWVSVITFWLLFMIGLGLGWFNIIIPHFSIIQKIWVGSALQCFFRPSVVMSTIHFLMEITDS